MSDTVIADGSKVTMHFSMHLEDGSVADSTKVNDLPGTVTMGDGTLSPNFEKHIYGLKANDQKRFTVPAADAFGEHNPDSVYQLSASQFPEDMELAEGLIIEFTQPNDAILPGVVRKVTGDEVTVDFNHPLAGQAVTFDVEIISVD